MDYALGNCEKSHDQASEFDKIYEVHSVIHQDVGRLSDSYKQKKLKELDEIMEIFWDYISHLIRARHQGDYYRYVRN